MNASDQEDFKQFAMLFKNDAKSDDAESDPSKQ